MKWHQILLVFLFVCLVHGGRRRDTKEISRVRHYGEEVEDDTNGQCSLEINCKSNVMGTLNMDGEISAPVRLPIRGPRGPKGRPGEKGERGEDGMAGLPGLPAVSYTPKKVAFFVGLDANMGPVHEHTDIIFDKVVTNIGGGYEESTGRFRAPWNGTYQFNVIVSAQGRQKAAVMILKNKQMVATVWAESIPYWATASNIAVLNLKQGDEVWLMLLNRASYLHGYMYSTFSGFMIFED